MSAASGVLARLIGAEAQKFEFSFIPQHDSCDVYEYDSCDGTVHVRGTSGVSIVRGAYDYLRTAGHVHVSWEGSNLCLPEQMPDASLKRVVSPYKYRIFYNQCTFGYTTVYWDWERWEKEIDWLALHGINSPLAMVGQEAIWRRIWSEMGLTDSEIDDVFTGPAFLPWNRMGNIYKHNGPIPHAWHDGQVELQKKILDRMRALGMKPVIPGFAGYVPGSLKRVRPDARIIRMPAFADFEERFDSYVLDAGDPLFPEIGGRFIQEYRKEFGRGRHYLVDTFNEMVPPVGKETRYKDLAKYGEAAYNSIRAGDPDGMWIMQGWTFSFHKDFWDKDSVKAFLSRVPDDRLLILDLECTRFPMWREHDGFYGKQWAYGVVHNFGATNFPFGDLKLYSEDPIRVMQNPAKGRLAGFSIAPEGSETNSVVYELLSDMSWSTTGIKLEGWLHDYCEDRYGACPPRIDAAWKKLLKTIYRTTVLRAQRYMRRPSLRSDAATLFDHVLLGEAIDLYLSCSDTLAGNKLYQRDIVDFVLVYLGHVADSRLVAAFREHMEGNLAERDRRVGECVGLLTQIDALIETLPDLTLSRWVSYARNLGRNSRESDYYEADAKKLITVWGGPILADYAVRAWGGIIRDFYIPRIKRFLEKATQYDEETALADIIEWENAWCRKPGVSELPEDERLSSSEDVIKEIRHLMDLHRGSMLNISGDVVGTWDPNMVSEESRVLEWEVTQYITDRGNYVVSYQFTDGYDCLYVERTALLEDGHVIDNDEHPGKTGFQNRDNMYRLSVGSMKAGARYSLQATVRGVGGTYTYGNVSLRKGNQRNLRNEE